MGIDSFGSLDPRLVMAKAKISTKEYPLMFGGG